MAGADSSHVATEPGLPSGKKNSLLSVKQIKNEWSAKLAKEMVFRLM